MKIKVVEFADISFTTENLSLPKAKKGIIKKHLQDQLLSKNCNIYKVSMWCC